MVSCVAELCGEHKASTAEFEKELEQHQEMLLGNHKLELLGTFLSNAYKLQVLGNKPLPAEDVWLLMVVWVLRAEPWTPMSHCYQALHISLCETGFLKTMGHF